MTIKKNKEEFFKYFIIHKYGVKGQQWLKNLPHHIAYWAEKLGLSSLKPLNNSSYHYLLSGFQKEQPIILKLGLNSFDQEATALGLFESIKVLAYDQGMLLLEQALPGLSLKSYFPYKDHQAIHIVANLIKSRKIFKPPEVFPSINNWLELLDKKQFLPAIYLSKARTLRDHLISTCPQVALLHGDLHHENILQHGHAWAVIDPKGVWADPVYEVVAFIYNPLPDILDRVDKISIIKNRIKLWSDILNIPCERIIKWCFVQCILSWLWVIEDKGDETPYKKLTEIFDRL